MYERCERLRPTLFRLASDTGDDDDALGKLPLCPGGRGRPLYLCYLEGDGMGVRCSGHWPGKEGMACFPEGSMLEQEVSSRRESVDAV